MAALGDTTMHEHAPAAEAAPRRRSRSLAQQLVETLTQQIHGGELRPGEKLPTESEIVRARGVSRTVVREAISRLQASGLVETRHGIGTFVLEPREPAGFGIDAATLVTVRDIIAVLELRISLETEAAALAAMRRSEADLQRIAQALAAFDAAIEADEQCVSADIAFHLAIGEATHNRYFVDFMRQLGKTIIPRARLNASQMMEGNRIDYLRRVNREHEDIYNAIRRADPEAARAAMRTHLANSRERFLRVQEAAEQDSRR